MEIAILWPASSTVGRAIYSGPGPRNDRSTLGVADSPRRGSFSQISSKMRFSHVNVPYIEVGQRRASGGEQISIIGSIPGPEDLVNIQETFQILDRAGHDALSDWWEKWYTLAKISESGITTCVDIGPAHYRIHWR